MFKIWRLALFFVLCLVVALLFNLPIQQVLPHVELPAMVQLTGIDGTVVHGRAQQINVNNFPLRDVRYRYKPACISTLKVCYRVDYEHGTAQVAYDLLNGDTEVSDARVEYPASEIARQIPDIPVVPQGRLELDIDELELLDGRPALLSGKLVWRDLGIDDEGIKLNIGDYRVDFSGNPRQYDFVFSDLDARLDINGDGKINSDGQYSIDVRIESRGTIEPQVKSVLGLVAAKISYNKYRIEQNGRMPSNFTSQLFD